MSNGGKYWADAYAVLVTADMIYNPLNQHTICEKFMCDMPAPKEPCAAPAVSRNILPLFSAIEAIRGKDGVSIVEVELRGGRFYFTRSDGSIIQTTAILSANDIYVSYDYQGPIGGGGDTVEEVLSDISKAAWAGKPYILEISPGEVVAQDIFSELKSSYTHNRPIIIKDLSSDGYHFPHIYAYENPDGIYKMGFSFILYNRIMVDILVEPDKEVVYSSRDIIKSITVNGIPKPIHNGGIEISTPEVYIIPDFTLQDIYLAATGQLRKQVECANICNAMKEGKLIYIRDEFGYLHLMSAYMEDLLYLTAYTAFGYSEIQASYWDHANENFYSHTILDESTTLNRYFLWVGNLATINGVSLMQRGGNILLPAFRKGAEGKRIINCGGLYSSENDETFALPGTDAEAESDYTLATTDDIEKVQQRMLFLTQAEYDALEKYDNKVLYIVTE